MRFRRLAHLAVILVASLTPGFIVALAVPAAGHAVYESSNPPDGGTVSSPPSQVSAQFSEPLIPEGSSMDVTDPCGRDVGGETSVIGESMTVSMSGAAKGGYTISWRAHSSVDGHVTEGAFSFSSTGGDPCPGEEEPSEDTSRDREKSDASGGSATSSGGGSASTSDSSAGSANANANGNSGERDRSDGGSSLESRGTNGGSAGRDSDRSRAGSDSTSDVAAAAPVAQEPETPSALEGIPVDGLVITLLVAALIGATGGKIYVSLTDDD